MHCSSTRAELVAVCLAALAQGPVHAATDSMAVVRKASYLLERAVDALASGDPSSYRHLGFAVEVLQSIPEGSRQAVSVGCLLLTDIGIRISLQLRPDERRASIDDALDVQGALVKAIMAMSAADLSSPVLLSMSSPEIADGEWAFVAVTYRIQHLIDLQ